MISTKSRYGLRALCQLASSKENTPISISEIAKSQNLSEKYLEQLFYKLKHQNIIKSVRGKNGGYILARDAKDISVKDIILCLEEDIEPAPCVRDGQCSDACMDSSCYVKPLWNELFDSVLKVIGEKSLEDLVRNQDDLP